MLPKLSLLSVAVILLLSSCQKQVRDAAPNTTLSSNSPVAAVQPQAVDRGWYGYYSGADVSNSDTLFAGDFIGNGVAKLPRYSLDSNVYSTIRYDVPARRNIPGDSIIYEVKIRNPKDAIHGGWDVNIGIKGVQHDAFINFVADSAYQQYTHAYVGNAEVTGVPQLIYDFEKFTALKLILKKGKAQIRINGQLVASLTYGAANRIGRVKSITFGGKGFPSATDVKIANSFTNNLILTENFNTDGQSTIVFY